LRRIVAWLRGQSIGAPALLAFSWACALAMASLLLWAGLTHGAVRGVVLVLAAGAAYGRRLCSRLGGLMSMDGFDGPPPEIDAKRWGDIAQDAVILLSMGLCAFGSGFLIPGPALGVLAAILVVSGALIGARRLGRLARPRLDVALSLTPFILAAALEPLWGWRGQTILIGLFAAGAALAFWLARLARPRA
jgi:hypothetical protein